MAKQFNFEILKFCEKFDENYNFLYDNYDNVAGFDEAVDAFDEFLSKHPRFVGQFVSFRGGMITSDREAAAFMFTLTDMMDF